MEREKSLISLTSRLGSLPYLSQLATGRSTANLVGRLELQAVLLWVEKTLVRL